VNLFVRQAAGGLLGSVALLLALGTVTAVHAQGDAPDDRRWFTIRGSAALEGSYTDNFFLTQKNRQSEWRETLTPSIEIALPPGRHEASLKYSPSVSHTSIDEGDVELFHLLSARGAFLLTDRLTLIPTEQFVRSDQTALSDPQAVRRGRTVLTSEVFTTALRYAQDVWTVTPRYSFTFNDEQAETTSTSSTTPPVALATVGGSVVSSASLERSILHTVGVEGSRNLTSRNVLGGSYEVTFADFRIADDFVSHVERLNFSREIDPVTTGRVEAEVTERYFQNDGTFMIYRGFVEGRREMTPALTVTGRLGYVFADFGSTNADDIEYLVRATYTGRLVRVALTSDETFQDTSADAINAGFIKARQHKIDVTFTPVDRFVLTLTGRYRDNRFTEPAGSTVAPDVTVTTAQGRERKDHIIEAGLELAYRMTRLLSLTAGYLHTTTESNQRGFSYDANSVHAGLVLTYE
jgi:putative beta-barrel porin BBP2